MDHDQYVPIAEVGRPHGIQGELRLKVYNLDSDLLLGKPEVRLVTVDGTVHEIEIRAARRVNNGILVRLGGVDDRSAAEALRGARIEILRSDLEPLDDEDEHYVCDLIGCRVLHDDAEVGVVQDVVSYPACDAIVVSLASGERVELPLSASHVEEIDEDERVIRVTSLEGL